MIESGPESTSLPEVELTDSSQDQAANLYLHRLKHSLAVMHTMQTADFITSYQGSIPLEKQGHVLGLRYAVNHAIFNSLTALRSIGLADQASQIINQDKLADQTV